MNSVLGYGIVLSEIMFLFCSTQCFISTMCFYFNKVVKIIHVNFYINTKIDAQNMMNYFYFRTSLKKLVFGILVVNITYTQWTNMHLLSNLQHIVLKKKLPVWVFLNYCRRFKNWKKMSFSNDTDNRSRYFKEIRKLHHD